MGSKYHGGARTGAGTEFERSAEREVGTVQCSFKPLAFNLFEEGTCPSRSPVMGVFTTKIEWQQSLSLPTHTNKRS